MTSKKYFVIHVANGIELPPVEVSKKTAEEYSGHKQDSSNVCDNGELATSVFYVCEGRR